MKKNIKSKILFVLTIIISIVWGLLLPWSYFLAYGFPAILFGSIAMKIILKSKSEKALFISSRIIFSSFLFNIFYYFFLAFAFNNIGRGMFVALLIYTLPLIFSSFLTYSSKGIKFEKWIRTPRRGYTNNALLAIMFSVAAIIIHTISEYNLYISYLRDTPSLTFSVISGFSVFILVLLFFTLLLTFFRRRNKKIMVNKILFSLEIGFLIVNFGIFLIIVLAYFDLDLAAFFFMFVFPLIIILSFIIGVIRALVYKFKHRSFKN